jgi:hypothetical protein
MTFVIHNCLTICDNAQFNPMAKHACGVGRASKSDK